MASPLYTHPSSPQPSEDAPTDQRDFTDRYNTKLSAGQEKKYQTWLKEQGERLGYDLGKDSYDYDMRGLFKENGGADLERGHMTDKHKKPNHPTFSDESEYHGQDENEGGKWGKKDGRDTFEPGATNQKYWPREDLQNYFKDMEPDTDLVYPAAESPA